MTEYVLVWETCNSRTRRPQMECTEFREGDVIVCDGHFMQMHRPLMDNERRRYRAMPNTSMAKMSIRQLDDSFVSSFRLPISPCDTAFPLIAERYGNVLPGLLDWDWLLVQPHFSSTQRFRASGRLS